MGRDRGGKVATKPVEIDKRTNIAHAIDEAAQWINLALNTPDRASRQMYMMHALRWLESTGVTETEPASISTIKYKIGG